MKTTKPKQKREKSTSTKGHYVTNAVLLPAVIEAKQLGKVTDKLIRMIQMIAERYSRKANFIGYSFREDMVSAAVMNLCNNALKFNPEKSSNPFSFYTTAIHNSFLQYMADEKKHRNIRDALLIDAGSNPSFNFMQGEDESGRFEMRESDEVVEKVDEIELDVDGNPIEKLHDDGEAVDAVKEVRIGRRDRVPGPVTRYKPGDFIIDEKGNIVITKNVAQPAQEEKPKKTRKAAVKKAEPTPEKVKKPRAKKVVDTPVEVKPKKSRAKKAE